MLRILLLGPWLVAACGDRDPVRARIEVVAVEPTFVPADVQDIAILFRTTQRGAVRVEASHPSGPEVVAERAAVETGTLETVSIPLAGFEPGANVVSLVLVPDGGAPPVEDKADFYLGEPDPASRDGGPEPPDAGRPGVDAGPEPCEADCVDVPVEEVCGTDGRTYDNRCLLQCAGAEELFQGSCDDPDFCIEQCLDAGFVPLCGVDGTTYLNECHLDCAGVEEDHIGPCFDF